MNSVGSAGTVGLSLLDAARRARSVPARVNVWSRARTRADLYARLLADWPALVEYVQRDAREIEALLYQGRGR